MTLTITKPKPKTVSSPKPKPKAIPSNFVYRRVTLIRESGYDFELDLLTHDRREVIIRCHPEASRFKIECIVFSKAINAGWEIVRVENYNPKGE